MTIAADALPITRKLLALYCMDDWKVEIDMRSTLQRYGCCKWATKTIGLSGFFLASAADDEIMALILHEVAHALSPGSYHYKVWKQQYARLLWRHQRGAAFAKLRADQYCKHMADSLIEFAKKSDADPITRRLPTPFDQPRDYPWKTSRVYLGRWSQIEPIRLIEENSKQYVWLSDNDLHETGNVWKSDKETQPFFMSWEDARQWLLKRESSKLDVVREMWEGDERDIRVNRIQQQIQQFEAMTAPAHCN